jgi:hypothetical protein
MFTVNFRATGLRILAPTKKIDCKHNASNAACRFATSSDGALMCPRPIGV